MKFFALTGDHAGVDNEGLQRGMDLELIEAVTKAVNVPVICGGGVGCGDDIVDGAKACLLYTSRKFFEKYGKPTWYVDRLIYTFPLHMAAKFNTCLLYTSRCV